MGQMFFSWIKCTMQLGPNTCVYGNVVHTAKQEKSTHVVKTFNISYFHKSFCMQRQYMESIFLNACIP